MLILAPPLDASDSDTSACSRKGLCSHVHGQAELGITPATRDGRMDGDEVMCLYVTEK